MDAIETGRGADAQGTPERWALRPLLLAGLGVATGLGVHLILGDSLEHRVGLSASQAARAMALVLFAAMIGFTIERRLRWASILFAAVIGVAGGLVMWWNGAPGGWSASEGWRMMSLLLAAAIAAPLFQAARDEGRLRAPYAAVHDHAWTNVVLWFAGWAFVAIVWILAWLLASLFQLVKVELLHELLMKSWFVRVLIGLAFGAALGLLREHDAVVRLLQRVVATVLAVLAPVLGIGLAWFLIILPFTGLQALWDATQATTPLLLSCAVGALILANAVIGNRDTEELRNPLIRFSAMLLAAVILPLALLAAVATGLRVGQYGYTPERLWAIVFVFIALLYGGAYLWSLIAGRLAWAQRVRPANLVLAFTLCGLGLLLATPLISFNRISTADQVVRLESGKTTPERFDWRALAFEFGKPGKDALAKLARSNNPAIREKAIAVASAKEPYGVPNGRDAARIETLDKRLRVLPAGTALAPELRNAIADSYPCGVNEVNCSLVFLEGGREALLLPESCFLPPAPRPTPSPSPGARTPVIVDVPSNCSLGEPDRYVLDRGKWVPASSVGRAPPTAEVKAARAAGYRAGQVEIRKVEQRQLFVGGQPIGDAFE